MKKSFSERLLALLIILGLVMAACNGEPKPPLNGNPVDTDNLASLILSAKQAIAGVKTSTNGVNIAENEYWVPAVTYNNLSLVLANAEAVLNNSAVSQQIVDDAAAMLSNRLNLFNEAKKPGVGAVKTGSLEDLLAAAHAALGTVSKSIDGTDIHEDDLWISVADFDAMEAGISAAEQELDNIVSQAQIDAAVIDLQNILDAFNRAERKNGLLRERLIPAGPGMAKNSVNAVAFRQDSLVTHGDTQYIAFYGPHTDRWTASIMLGQRKLHESEFEVIDTGIEGYANNAHNSISIMTDGDGVLHMA